MKKLDGAKGLWDEYLHEIIRSYHTTPHSTTKETPFQMVYEDDAMIPIEVNYPTWQHLDFDENLNREGLDNSID